VYRAFSPFYLGFMPGMGVDDSLTGDYLYYSASNPGSPITVSNVTIAEGTVVMQYTPAVSYPAGAQSTIPIFSFNTAGAQPWLSLDENAGTTIAQLDDGVSVAGVGFNRAAGSPILIKANWHRGNNRKSVSIDGVNVAADHTVDFPIWAASAPDYFLYLGTHNAWTSATGTFAEIYVYDYEW